VFRTPGVLPLYLASVVARLPQGAEGIVLLLRTRDITGSYAAGGVVTAAFGLAVGVGQPLLGRLIDRRGQQVVLVPGALVGGAALVVFATLPDNAPLGALIALAVVAGGASPPINSCLRALLSEVIAPALRHRAFAIDSTVFELVYIAGPTLIVGGVGSWSLHAAVAACAFFHVAGTIAFARTRLSREARGTEGVADDLLGPLRDPGVLVLLATVALFGLSIACLEVGLAAFAGDEGHRSAVGFLLACSGVGSMAGGLAAARSRPPEDGARRLAALLALTAVLAVPMGLVHSLPAMAVAVVVASVGIAPALALIFSLVSDVAPAGSLTEAMTWLGSLISFGIAGGSALAGWLVESAGTTVVLFGFAVYCVAAAAVVASRAPALAART
jgi:MFS family permease